MPLSESAPAYLHSYLAPLALYLWRRAFVNEGQWPGGNQRLLEIPEARAFSIDDAYEFRLAELVLSSGLVALPWLSLAGPPPT